MKMQKHTWAVMAAMIMFLMLLTTSCGVGPKSTVSLEQEKTEENQKILLKNQPPVKLKYSLERENINKRTELWNDKNKVSYIYLVDFGKVMAFFPIKGKVSSVNSQITNPEQVYWKHSLSSYGMVTIPSPAEDGSYGSNGDAIYFFTTEGTYVEWPGNYMLCDKPLRLSTPPQITRAIE